MKRAAQAESARFVATHIAPGLTPEEEAELADRLLIPAVPPNAAQRLDALMPTIEPEDIAHLDTEMYVRYVDLGVGPDLRNVRVSVENTLHKYQLYDTIMGQPIQLPMELLCRRLSAIGYRRYENQFSKLTIRTSAPLRGTTSLHKSGKLLVTGTINMDVARFLACTYVPKKLLPLLGLAHTEARNETLSNIVVKMETPYTFAPFLMAQREEEVTYEPARFSSAMLKNAGLVKSLPWAVAGDSNYSVANMLARRFHEPELPRRKWAILFFKPNRALFVGLTDMNDIAPVMRVADAIAYRYRYEHPVNREEEDVLRARYTRKRTRRTKPKSAPVHKKVKR